MEQEKKQKTRTGQDIAVEILSGAATAFIYTDEEIRNTLPPDQAEEFIAQRNRVIEENHFNDIKFDVADAIRRVEEKRARKMAAQEQMPLAAEESTPYNVSGEENP